MPLYLLAVFGKNEKANISMEEKYSLSSMVKKNRPATFIYPIYSLIGDWVMFKDMIIGKIKF